MKNAAFIKAVRAVLAGADPVAEARELTVANVMTLIAADLAAMSGPALASAYNLLSPEKPVTRFATPEDGRKRLALKIEARKLATALAAGETAESAKAKVVAKGKEQVAAIIASGEVMDKRLAKLNGLKTIVEAKKKPTALKVVRSFSAGEKITLLVGANPKREGSASAEVFAKYKTGMTVAEFYVAGGSATHLKWDIGHNFIEVK